MLWLLPLTISISVLGLFVVLAAAASASGSEGRAQEQVAKSRQRTVNVGSRPSFQAQPTASTTLAVDILSTPWATLDSNPKPGEELPGVFVVHAVVTNTGDVTAADLTVNLNYFEDPVSNWVLLPEEDPERTVAELSPHTAYHAYWFAGYSKVFSTTHQYMIEVDADNTDPVSAYDAVTTRSTVSSGNSGATAVGAEVVVGVAFTVTVDYDLGSNPQKAGFSPVGNFDFDAGANRLLASQVVFFEDVGPQAMTVADRLYFDTLPDFADNATVTYTFIALTPSDTRLCTFAAVGYQSTAKYDQFYCSTDHGTVVPITGTVSLSLTKQVSSVAVQQNELLTYTIQYTNTGSLPVQFVWIWDEIDQAIGSVVPGSVFPPSDPDVTTDHLVAWDIGDLEPNDGGTASFAIRVDGDGQDLADGTAVVNHAFFGIKDGSLPANPGLTSTVTSTIAAPTIAVGKTDGRATAEPFDALTYTLRITNTGSVTATGLIITDVLPDHVIYIPLDATPDETQRDLPTLVWENLGPISPRGGAVVIEIPVTVAPFAENGAVLTNTMMVQYENDSAAGYVFAVETATDKTTVESPVLSISKSAFPDPVLTGNVLTYTLHYANSGPAPATSLVITDVVPSSTTYQSCSGGSACVESSGVVSWSIDTLPAESDGNVSFSVSVSDTLADGAQLHNNDYRISADQSPFVFGTPVTTTVRKDAALVEGLTFIDRNGDGTYNAGDDVLPGVAITLTNATQLFTTTNASGTYRFRLELPGPISVAAELPVDYLRTTNGMVFLESVFGVTQTVNFGYAPIASTFGTVYGTVFEDTDHDGSQGQGEYGLQGVTVTSALAVTPAVTTNNLGQYTLHFDSSGSSTITEIDPLFYVSTTPNQVVTDVVVGSGTAVNYGDFLGIRITGSVFNDANINGVNDDGDFVSEAVVTADGDSFETDSTGVYTLYVAIDDADDVLITETDPLGYISTNAVPGAAMSRVDANTLRLTSPISGAVYYSGDFGDVLASQVITISGYVWEDNGAGAGGVANGLRDGTEPGLGGAIVSLSSGLTQTTGSDGFFLLYGPAGDAITVSETNPSGYRSTNAIPGDNANKLDNDGLIVSPLSGGSTSAGNLFGDVSQESAAVITGTVFDDANENGSLDLGESGIAGVTVTLQSTGGVSIVVLTDPSGNYQFTVAPGTDVRITSAGPGGSFYSTTPESIILRPPAAGLYPDNDFGYSDDTDVALIHGIVYNDLNSNGEQDLGELGLAGAVITLNDGQSITTTGNGLISGTFAFSVTEQRIYHVHEINPPGYRSTTSDDVYVPAWSGGSYYVDFGDTINPATASIFGTVFDDLNGNGVQNPDEPGLAGVVISVTVSGGVITDTTEEFGQFNYGFENVEAGFHTVREQDPALPGYRSTTPDEATLLVQINQSYIVDFGDTTSEGFSSIVGTVFDDVSGDGVQDPAEEGIPDVLVSLSNGLTTTTNAIGGYTFGVEETGSVRVMETDPLGYQSTTPNTVTVDVAELGQVYTVNFGDSNNPFTASFFGTVFEDLNANGAWDATEPPIGGVTVTINSSGSFITNEWGQFTFLIESPGTYTVTEIDLPGYISTNAIPGDPAVSKVDNNTLRGVATLGSDLGDNLFGDVQASQVITISGYVWDDNGEGRGTPGDGEWNGAEPGLSGATVSLSSGMTQTTGSDGFFLLYAPPGQAITVTETNPDGYISTNAIPGNNASKIDNDRLLVAATLAGGDACRDNLFGDTAQTAPCICGPDPFEEDDSAEAASPLFIGAANSQTHNFCDDATDWVTFTAEANRVYTITTSSWGQRADTFLTLFDADGRTRLAANDDYKDAGDFSSRIVWQAPASGVYYVRITNRAGLSGCDTEYDVWVERSVTRVLHLPILVRNRSTTAATELRSLPSPLGVIDHSCRDAYEVDDTWQQAQGIVAGVLQTHSFDSDPSEYAADKDFVSFNGAAGQTVTFTVAAITNTQTLLELYDESGAALDVTGTTQLAWTPDAGGRHFLSISPLTVTYGCADTAGYSLLMEETPVYALFLPVTVRNR